MTIRISVHSLQKFRAGEKVKLKKDGSDTVLITLPIDGLEVFVEEEPGVTGGITKVRLVAGQ